MLLVKTIVKSSDIEGLGLFAAEKIPKGTSVWKFDPRFDIGFEVHDVEKMDPLQKDLILRYAYLSIESKKYIFCIDDARFMNHSVQNKNIHLAQFPGEIETRCVASRDIEEGEEILTDYTSFDAVDAASHDPYLEQ